MARTAADKVDGPSVIAAEVGVSDAATAEAGVAAESAEPAVEVSVTMIGSSEESDELALVSEEDVGVDDDVEAAALAVAE